MLENISSIGDNISWFILTWDLLIFVFFVVVSFMYGLSLGPDRIPVSLMSIYASLAIVTNVPYLDTLTEKINWEYSYIFKIIGFWGIIVLLFVVLIQTSLLQYRTPVFESWKERKRWFKVMIFGFLHVGLLTSITISFLPTELIANLLPVTRFIFFNQITRFLWLVAPLIVMILVQLETNKEIEMNEPPAK